MVGTNEFMKIYGKWDILSVEILVSGVKQYQCCWCMVSYISYRTCTLKKSDMHFILPLFVWTSWDLGRYVWSF